MKKILAILFLCSAFFNAHAQTGAGNFSRFSLKGLQSYPYAASPITIQSLAFKNNLQYAWTVSYRSMGLTVSARMSIPAGLRIKGMVIMLRGHQNVRGYHTGKGTENPARAYLERGYAVIAPDFPGYGSSSPVPAPEELHQFYSTVNAVELYKSLEQPRFEYAAGVPSKDRIELPSSFAKIVLWGHSNGGQAAIHFLEIIGKPVPTVLWAPVCVPFPDNMVHYRRNRAQWAAQFKQEHPAADFSLLAFLDRIAPGTPILLEQGDKDTSVPKAWADAFVKAAADENERREKEGKGKINLRYEVYKNADHNLNPYWGTVLSGDAAFWDSH